MTTDPSENRVGPDSTVEDVDLTETEIRVGGERLTDAKAEEIVQRTLAEVRRRNLIPGRKSLSGRSGEHSPVIQFRVPPDLRDRVDRLAEQEGLTPSKLARRALEEYLTTHDPDRHSA